MNSDHSFEPPGPPWIELHPNADAPSYLCFYYSSILSARPVRDVNRIVPVGHSYVADCKVDPNWETKTFGLFSTCQQDVRKGVVKNRSPYLFFFGNRVIGRAERGITGFYQLRWYAHGGTNEGDYCLAAETCHFVERPLSFEEVNRNIGTNLSNRRPRLSMKVAPEQTRRLIGMLMKQQDITSEYIADIRRLERLNARASGGLTYMNFRRRDSYSWRAAAEVKGLGIPSTRQKIRNSGSQDTWLCEHCGEISLSYSRLKLCPACGAHGTLAQKNAV